MTILAVNNTSSLSGMSLTVSTSLVTAERRVECQHSLVVGMMLTPVHAPTS